MSLFEILVALVLRVFGYRKVTAASVLTTTGGTPVINGKVTLSYAKAAGKWVQDGTGTTNTSGQAQESVFLKKGTYDFRVSFTGGNGLGPSSAEKDGVAV